MTLSHNSIIRGFNGICQQAPRIGMSDSQDFIDYCLAWHRMVHEHHHHEEVNLFPAIEEATGQNGVMDNEVDQHAAFCGGLDDFKTYLTGLKFMDEEFDSKRLIEIMDSFLEPLYTHLAAEPDALVALSRFSSLERDFDLAKIAREAGKKSVTLDFALNVLPIFLLNMESDEFKGGMWKDFPNVPAPVRFVMKSDFPLWQRKQLRFLSEFSNPYQVECLNSYRNIMISSGK
jgi:hemerythrin-like domain-containing protein